MNQHRNQLIKPNRNQLIKPNRNQLIKPNRNQLIKPNRNQLIKPNRDQLLNHRKLNRSKKEMGSKDFESQRNIKMMKLKWTCNKSNLKETIRITMTVSMKIKSK